MKTEEVLRKLDDRQRQIVNSTSGLQKDNLLRRLAEGYAIVKRDQGGDILVKLGYSYRLLTRGGSDVAT